MENINLFTEPDVNQPTIIAAFAGWPDAGEVATGAVRYLRDKLHAVPFAEILPDEFYVLTEQRPQTSLAENPWERRLTWPSNQFFYWKSRGEAPDLVLLLGVEPNLKWKSFVEAILALAERLSARRIITLGGTLDSIPHTMDPLVSGASSDPELRAALKFLSVHPSGYEGPTSIHSALLDAAHNRGLSSASLWGHGPTYLQSTPNPRVCYAILRRLVALLVLPLDLDDLRETARDFDRQVEEAVSKNPELREYVNQLEQALEDVQGESDEEMPSPGDVVKDLEEYLRRRREDQQSGEDRGAEG